MKTLSILSIAIAVSFMGVAQPSAYRKIMSEKDQLDPEVFFAQLKGFQAANKEFSNVYYQLGKFELENFSNLDPLVDRIASRQYVYNSKTNFSLAKNFLDEKEVARNPEWYDVPPLKRDSVIVLANNLMDEKYQGTINYAEAYEKLLFHYDKAVTHYLRAREDFITINTSAENLRQLFLKTNDSLKQAIRNVGTSFDSSMHHLDNYRETYQLLPHTEKRKVIVNFNKIDHFRMNGITPTNFLADYIDVWDYKHWSEDFLNLIKVEVDGLQEEIRTAYDFFTSTNNRLVNGEECIQANIDDRKFQRIINLVTKYDNQSVLIDIFRYLLAKLEYGNQLVYERNCNIISGPPTDDLISRKARVYQNLFSAFAKTDSVDNLILTSGHGQKSFEWFFSEMMDGENGSLDFANKQRLENKSSFRDEVVKLAELSGKQRFQSDSIYYQTFSVNDSLLVSGGNREAADSIEVFNRLEVSDSLHFLIAKEVGNVKILGAQQIEEDYIVLWEQSTYKNEDIEFFKTVSDSSFVIGGRTWLKHISHSGLEKSTIKLKSKDSIVFVNYNELQGSFEIVQAKDTIYTMTTIGFNGAVSVDGPVVLPGKFLNMWSQDQSLWFFSASDTEQNTVITASLWDGETKKINEKIEYNFSSLMTNPLLIKNDNESITVLSQNAQSENEFIYSILDYSGSIQHEEIF
ncbi:MAG: hypothetical protein ABJG78_13645 [Cyclobacteriaceae bacterium]